MPLKVGDKVDISTSGGTVPEVQYTVVRMGRRVTIRDEAGNQRTVDENELQPFHRGDWG